MEALQGANSAVVHKVHQLLIARERSNRYYTQQEVELELGLERGEIGKFYWSMNHGEGGNKKKARTMALLREAGVFRVKGKQPKRQSTQHWFAFVGRGPAKRHPPPFSVRDDEHVFEFKDYTSDPAAPVESDVDLEKVANEPGDTPTGPTPPSYTVMTRSRRIMAAPPSAAGGAHVSQNMGQTECHTEEEMRTELRQLSFKLSKCETALESHGSYLGITDPAILLDQLKALRRKDEHLREMLLILLRASPLQAPKPIPSRLANAAALLPNTPPSQAPPPQAPPHQAPPRQAPRPPRVTLGPRLTPPSPTTHALTTSAPTPSAPATPAPTPPASTPASGRASNLRRSCNFAETHARGKRARVAATNASAAASAPAAPPSTSLPRPLPPPTPAAALTALPLWSSSCPSHLTPRPKTTPAVPPGKTLSLYEALGLTPPPKASAPASAPGQSGRTTGITNNGSGDTFRSSTPPAYFPGRHTLYRANIPRGWAVEDVGGSANGGNTPCGIREKISSSPPAEGLPRRGHGVGIGDSSRHAERGRPRATASASSTTGGRSSDEGPRAPESEAPSNPPKNGYFTSGGEMSLARGIGSTLAGAKGGQGSLAMATEMATVALAGPAEERATVRDLADVAMAFNMRRSRVSSPALAEVEERAAGSTARDPSTNDIHRDGDKRMVVEGRGTTAVASLGAAASTGVPPSKTGAQSEVVATAAIVTGKIVKKELVEVDGSGDDEAVEANPVRSGRSATSSRGTREGQRRTPTRPLRIFLRLNRSSAAAIVKSGAPTGSTNLSPTCSGDAQAGTPAMQQGVEAASPPARASVAVTPPGNAAPSGKSESAFGEDGVAKKPPVGMVPAEPDVDAPRRGNGNDGCGGRPPRKRRKSAQTSGWRSRYNADEFELGGFSSSSRGDSDAVSDGGVKQPRDGGVGGVGSVGTRGNEEGDMDWDKTLVDVGGDENSDEDELGDDGERGVGGGRDVRRVRFVRKRDPFYAWKRRCADGTCQIGVSSGFKGKPAVYCGAHRDAGMGNVTHRRCRAPGCNHQPSFNTEGKRAVYCRAHKRNGMINVSSSRCIIPGCIRQPSFNMEGEKGRIYCGAHKRNGMINVSSPWCNSPGCRVQPSFGFDEDPKATYCDAHKKPRMVNVRTRNCRASRETRRSWSTTENEGSTSESIPRTDDAASAAAAAADLLWYSVKHKKPSLDDLTPQPLHVYDRHVSSDSSIAQEPPRPLPLAAMVTPMEVAAAVPAPTAPGSGIDDNEVDRVDAGGGSSETGCALAVPGRKERSALC